MAKSNYNAANLSVLEGLDAVRAKPGMYIGSKDSRGFMHCIYEIFDNCVDEALAGYCSEIEIKVLGDNKFEIIDNGRGIPVDTDKSTKMSGVELVLTKLHAGGKFSDENYVKSGGLHGVGSSVVNALSSKMVAKVWRNSKEYKMEFSKGKVGKFDKLGNFTLSTTKVGELEVSDSPTSHKTGTSIYFELDREIFSNASYSFEALNKRLLQTSYLVPKLKIKLEDLREEVGEDIDSEFEKSKVYYSENGIVDFVEAISDSEPINDIWTIQGTDYFEENAQSLDSNNNLKMKVVKKDVEVSMSFRWVNNYEQRVDSFVNIISTPFGGTHYDGFVSSLTKVIRNVISDNARKLKFNPKDDKIEREDVLAGLRAIVSVKLHDPVFEGQTKEILGTSQVRGIVQNIATKQLEHIFTTGKKEYKAGASKVLEKIVAEMKARIGAKKQKELLRKKANIEGASSMPSKLVDCDSNDPSETELFIVEGDSALGTAKLARNSRTQALLPIRGKILNVQKASVSQMLSNAECSSIIQVIGAGSKNTFDINLARYSKIVFMTDADVDGAHIRILLLTLFYNYLPQMIEEGRVYSAVPPLHRIELAKKQVKNLEEKYIYTYKEEELVEKLKELDSKNIAYKEDIQRYKGLGEMDADQLADTTMDPSKRLLRRVEMPQAAESKDIFDLLMGDEVAPRKEFITTNSQRVDRDKIDA